MSETIPQDVMEAARLALTEVQNNIYLDASSDYPGIEYDDAGCTEAIAYALMAERERCARIADAVRAANDTGSGFDSQPAHSAAFRIAAAIRGGTDARTPVTHDPA